MTNFDKVIKCINDKYVYIQTHNFPDPDAIASAYGMQELLKTKGIESTICYKGNIDRMSMVKMISELDINAVRIDDNFYQNLEQPIIFIDAQKGNANISDIGSGKCICIDHHQIYEDNQYLYADIRPEVGACSSIVAEYYRDNKVEISKNAATALMYGIKIDTANMSRGVSDLDLDMFYDLYKKCDRNIINSLDLCTMQLEDLHAYSNAIESINICDNIGFANTGIDCHEALIATISDFVLAVDSVEIAVVYSIRKDGIKLSVRSNSKYNSGIITKEALKDIGNGGGHEMMAGGFVPWTNTKDTDRLIQSLKVRFIDTIKKSKL